MHYCKMYAIILHLITLHLIKSEDKIQIQAFLVGPSRSVAVSKDRADIGGKLMGLLASELDQPMQGHFIVQTVATTALVGKQKEDSGYAVF